MSTLLIPGHSIHPSAPPLPDTSTDRFRDSQALQMGPLWSLSLTSGVARPENCPKATPRADLLEKLPVWIPKLPGMEKPARAQATVPLALSFQRLGTHPPGRDPPNAQFSGRMLSAHHLSIQAPDTDFSLACGDFPLLCCSVLLLLLRSFRSFLQALERSEGARQGVPLERLCAQNRDGAATAGPAAPVACSCHP